MKLPVILILLLSLSGYLVNAQDPVFSQYYVNPINLNPAFSGTANSYRAVVVHRRQWSGAIANVTTAFALDGNLGDYSGWGIQVLQDSQAGGLLKTTNISGSLAHNIRLTKESFLGFGIKFGVYQKLLDWQSLTFEDQIDPRLGIVNDTNERFGRDNVVNGDIGIGILYSSKKFFIGTSFNHLNRPKENFTTTSNNQLEIKYTILGGAFIHLQNAQRDPFTITPNIIYEKFSTFDYWNLGMSFSTKDWTAGAMYRIDDSIILSVGSNGKNFKVGYSYDLPIAEFGPVVGNSHEITVTYLFKPNKSNKIANRYKGKCPNFYKRLF